MSRDKLWNYSRLCGLWAKALIWTGPALLVLAALVEAGGRKGGVDAGWVVTALAAFSSAALVFFFLLRMWMRPTAVPTGRLDEARRDKGTPRLLEAGPGDWRKWSAILGACLFLGCAMMMTFLVGILGSGGTAEGVLAGVLVAWGLVTLDDLRALRRIETEEGRTYYAACRRPVAVGSALVWQPHTGGA